MARKRAEEAGGGVLRAEAVTANGMVHVLATQGRAKKYGPWDVHVLTPDEAKRLARRHTRLSYPEIARAMGRPTHSTVVHGEQRMAAMLRAEPEEQVVVDLGGDPGGGVLITELYRRIERDVRTEVR